MPFSITHTLRNPERKNTINLYSSRSSAAENLARLRKRKYDRLPCIGHGIVSDSGTGRPTDIYFKGDWWEIKSDNYRHTMKETDVHLALRSAFPDSQFLRGPRTGNWRNDIVQIMPDGTRFGIEIDCGTMHEEQVKARWRKLLDCKMNILVAVAPRFDPPLKRIKQLLKWGGEVGDFIDFSYYAPLQELVTNPSGRIWTDCEASGFTLEELWKNPVILQSQVA